MATYQMPPQNNNYGNNANGGAIDYDKRSQEALPRRVIDNKDKPMTQMERWVDDVSTSIWVNVVKPALGQILMNAMMTFSSQLAHSIFGINTAPVDNSWTNYSGYGRGYNPQGRPSDNLRNRQRGVSREEAFGPNNGEPPSGKREVVYLYGDDWKRIIRFELQADGNQILKDMRMKIAKTGYVTVGAYIDNVNYYDKQYEYKYDDILHSWGWTDLTEADVRWNMLYKRKWELVLPEEEPIGQYR